MTTRWRTKIPAHATPDIPLRETKSKAKRRDPVTLPNGFALFKPSWTALLLNIMEVAKLAAMPAFSGLIAFLALYTASQHRGSGNEALFNGLGAVGIVMALVLLIVISPALALVQLKSARGELTDFRDEFVTGLPLLWRFLAVNILVGLMTLLGFILLIVPGILILKRFYLAQYYVLEHELGVIDSLKAAAADAKLYSTALWNVVLVSLGIKLISFGGGAGIVVGSLLQLVYAYAPAVRYVEITEAKRDEITYAKREHLARKPTKRHAKK